jgi:hypothetical protein
MKITIILASINAVILLTISLLHFYWMLGGKWGGAQALPTNPEGKQVLNPSAVACGIVAVALLIGSLLFAHFAGLSFLDFDWLPSKLKTHPSKLEILRGGLWAAAAVFLLRAMGDFKFVGFTKSVKNTSFGRLDTLYYSPLCLVLGTISLIILWQTT